MKIIWSPLAALRAGEAVDYMARSNPTAAAQWADRLMESIELLAQFPRRGRPVPEIGRPEFRQVVHHPYRVIYRVDPTRVVILTIRHGRRDWDNQEVRP